MTARNSQNPITNQLRRLERELFTAMRWAQDTSSVEAVMEVLDIFHRMSLYTDMERQFAGVQDTFVAASSDVYRENDETGEPWINTFQNHVTRAFTHGTHLHIQIEAAVGHPEWVENYADAVVCNLFRWASCMDLFHAEGFFDCKNMERELYAGIKAIEANPATFGLAGVIQDIDACCKPCEYGDYRRAVFMAVLEAVRFNERL